MWSKKITGGRVTFIDHFQCPVFDNERDILYDGYYLTMTRRGGITLTVSFLIFSSSFIEWMNLIEYVKDKGPKLTDGHHLRSIYVTKFRPQFLSLDFC